MQDLRLKTQNYVRVEMIALNLRKILHKFNAFATNLT